MNPAIRRIRRILFIVALLIAGVSWICGLIGTARGMGLGADVESVSEWLIHANDPTYLWNGRIVVCSQQSSRIQVYDDDGRLLLVRNTAARGHLYSAAFSGNQMILTIRRRNQPEKRVYDSDFHLLASSDNGKPTINEAAQLKVHWSLFGVKVEVPNGSETRIVHLQPFAIERLPQMPLLGPVHGPIVLAGFILLAAAEQRRRSPSPSSPAN